MIDDKVQKAIDIIQQPCMSEQCKEFIQKYIKDNEIDYVLEFGSGGSTKMFAELDCAVVTIESNPTYYLAIREVCKSYKNVYPLLAMDTKSYIFSSVFGLDADLIFIDGVEREALMEKYFMTTYPWEHLMVHDAERQEYQQGFDFLRKIATDVSPASDLAPPLNIFACKRNEE